MLNSKLRGFRQVIIFLFLNDVNNVRIPLLEVWSKRIAITHNSVGRDTMLHERLRCSVTATDVRCITEDRKRNGTSREVAISNNYGITSEII